MPKPCLNQFEWNQIHIILCPCNHLPRCFLPPDSAPAHTYLYALYFIGSGAFTMKSILHCYSTQKARPPHIEETGCNLVHRKTPRLISLSIAWYPCIQNPRPRHSQVNWRLSIRQFSWLQFIVSLRLPKKISQ